MDCPSTPEPAYLNLPGWRCVPVYALPFSSSDEKKISADPSFNAFTARSLMPTNIPSDPRIWSRQQVYFWLEWCVESFSLPPLDVEQFYMNGRGLCLLRKIDWRDRAPRSGDILYNALQFLLQKQLDKSISNNNKSSYNGNALVPENISAALLQHASLHETSKNLLSLCTTATHQASMNAWARSVSSDFHSMGHVVHESEPVNGLNLSSMTMSSDADSPAEASPDPSPDNLNKSETNSSRTNGHTDSGPITTDLNSNVVQVRNLKQYDDKPMENSSEKINVRLLWDFLQQLLNDSQQRYNCCIMWKDKPKGVFKITDPHRLAGLWGKQKNHLNMNFDKMSRALRYYYRVRILQKEPGERHCYRFLRHPNELRHCKQRSLLTKDTIPILNNSTSNGNHNSLVESGDAETVLDMSIKEEGSSPGDAD